MIWVKLIRIRADAQKNTYICAQQYDNIHILKIVTIITILNYALLPELNSVDVLNCDFYNNI